MKLEIFNDKITKVVKEQGLIDASIEPICSAFLQYSNDIMLSEQDDLLKMTQLTIIFEALNQSIPQSNPLKQKLNEIRLLRWGSHYGTPTITFLLTYGVEIEQTRKLFTDKELAQSKDKPWTRTVDRKLTPDKENLVLIDTDATEQVSMPLEEEKTGQFLKTHNPSGGFTTTPCDPVSQKFIEYASEVALKSGTVLEIGAAFGAASLQALARGARVFCNDIDPSNLAVVRNRHLKFLQEKQGSVTGDDSKLVLVPGSFPDELAGLPNNFFDAILICRVLHFFTGEQIEKSLEQLTTHLKPGGKLFVVCETPYLKNWQKFIPEFERRVVQGVKWPGEITNPAEYESSGRAASLPKFVHWISKEVLEKSLLQSKLGVEHLSYIDRCGQFPDDLLLDQRESIGAVAAKPY